MTSFALEKMDSDDSSSSLEAPEWEPQARTVSESSLTTSAEQLALMGFANRLYSVSSSNDPGIADEKDLRVEAKLLMSLSGIPPSSITVDSGRITPPSDASSCHSMSSRQRDSFRFSCPSLSLEPNGGAVMEEASSSSSFSSKGSVASSPAALLGRTLKVEDVDALRLSSEAMVRNIMQSYEKAIQWRIQSWIKSLSRILISKETQLEEMGMATEDNLKILRESSEAMLIVRLEEIRNDIKVIDACNHFDVLPQKAQSYQDEPAQKRQRMSDNLEEGHYEYTVSHLLNLDVDLNLHAPAVGNAAIDLKVPGTMNGTFVSFENGREQITDVVIDINTDILASMIEKSSRIVVRSVVEAVLKGEETKPEGEERSTTGESAQVSEDDAVEDNSSVRKACDTSETCPTPGINPQIQLSQAAPASTTPKRKVSDERIGDLVFVTPRECTSSSSSTEGCDHDDQRPVILSIPNDFGEGQPKPMLAPQPSARGLVMKTSILEPPSIVTPSKSSLSFIESDGEGPNLPTLVEVALQLQAK